MELLKNAKDMSVFCVKRKTYSGQAIFIRRLSDERIKNINFWIE